MAQYFHVPVYLGIDAHRPYLAHRVNRSRHIIPIHADALRMDQILLPKTVSTILLMDVIEHFAKPDGRRLLQLAEQIAYDRVIVFTPRGFFPQGAFDVYNLKGEEFQKHRSGWEPEEFARSGYEVIVMKGYHDQRNLSFLQAFGPHHPPIDAIFAYKEFK